MTVLVAGFDAAWGGTGWCIATERGPLEAGHVVTDGAYRLVRLQSVLQSLEHRLADHTLALHRSDPPPRAAIERLPWSYRRPGSQVRTVFGISGCAHVIAAWGTRRDWGYPWLIPPTDDRGKPKPGAKPRAPAPGWRQWWGIRGKGRPAKKRDAIRHVRALGWGDLLELLPLMSGDDVDANGDGPRGDTAEGILIAVGAARHPEQAPRMPRRWPDMAV